jgi:pimeloyl-ACP methyl ester carboxylesterase
LFCVLKQQEADLSSRLLVHRQTIKVGMTGGEFDRSAGAYRLTTAEGLLSNWNQTIPLEDKSQWRNPAVAQAYQQQALLSKGQKYWDAKDIAVPTLVIRGERDFWSRPVDLTALKAELVNAPRVETVTIPDGTHYLFLDCPERGRDRFLQEVLSFLQE